MKDKKSTVINKEFLSQNAIWLVLLVLIVVMSIANPKFLTVNNLVTMLTGEACKGIIAFGIMFCILSKGNDISTGAAAAFVGTVTGALVQSSDYAQRIFGSFGQTSTVVAILAGILIGVIIGLINGSLIAYTHVPPFIATMGMQLILRAFSKVVADRPVSNLPESFRFFGSGYMGPFPVIVLVFILFFIISAVLLTQTRFGKRVYAVGGNENAARAAGINVEKTLVSVYVYSGICAAVAGMCLAGRAGSVDPSSTGLNYEFDAIAAATVGGTSHTGGIARISGVLCGILILGVVNNGLVMMKVDDNMTNIIKGAIIIGSVVLDMRKNRKKI
jgi:ribose/xylose/arabinose/galactoside ABC-type transport system permease subunit